MVVSWNKGTSKSSISMGFSLINIYKPSILGIPHDELETTVLSKFDPQKHRRSDAQGRCRAPQRGSRLGHNFMSEAYLFGRILDGVSIHI